MTELFRYIEQAFVVPSGTRAVDVDRQSDLQNSLRSAITNQLPPDRIRGIADEFIVKHFTSSGSDPFQLGRQLLLLRSKLLLLPHHGRHDVEQLIAGVFDSNAHAVVGSRAFLEDKALLDDALVSVKIVTAFDRVNAADLVAMRQAMAFVDDFAAGQVTDLTAGGIRTTLRRPIRIPSVFVRSLTAPPDVTRPYPAPDPAADPAARQRTALIARQGHLKTAYETIMSLPPEQLELKPLRTPASRPPATSQDTEHSDVHGGAGVMQNLRSFLSPHDESGGEASGSVTDTVSATPTFLALSQAALERLGDDVRQTLEGAYIDVAGAPVSDVVTAIKREWQELSRQLAPYQIPAPARVFRVGVHLFAVQESASATGPGTKERRL